MSNICPGCNKFAPLSEPELEDPEVDDNGDGSGTVTVRAVRNSDCCGDEMKEYTFELEYDAAQDLLDHYQERHGSEEVTEPEVEVSLDTTARRQTTATKRGKLRKDGTRGPSKVVNIGYRYQKQFFGVAGTARIVCADCQEEVAVVELSDEAQASSFEELN